MLRDVVAGEFGLNSAEFEVTAASGIVTIAGLVALLEPAMSLLARVRHTEGVVAVRDRLVVAEASGQLIGALLAADGRCNLGS